MADKAVVKKKEKSYTAVVGLTFADGTRVEAGKKVSAELLDTARWMIKSGRVK
jgi:hypothetical protein